MVNTISPASGFPENDAGGGAFSYHPLYDHHHRLSGSCAFSHAVYYRRGCWDVTWLDPGSFVCLLFGAPVLSTYPPEAKASDHPVVYYDDPQIYRGLIQVKNAIFLVLLSIPSSLFEMSFIVGDSFAAASHHHAARSSPHDCFVWASFQVASYRTRMDALH